MYESKTSLALGGYDAVTFFEGEKPLIGNFDLKTQMDGMTYCFSSKDNLARFVRNPSSFLPQFGGHCAFSCGLYGGLRPGSAKHWKVVYGKLYLLEGPRAQWCWEKFPRLIPWGHQNYERKLRGIRVKS